jgi:tetratricopeptide (TPR) repeat protein
MKNIFFLVLFVSFFNSYGQNYDALIKKADSCYNAKQYKKATEFYTKAFQVDPNSKKNFYNAACASSLANDKKKSLDWLEIAVNNGFNSADHINSDSDLDNIRKEKKFKKIIDNLQKSIALIEADYDKPLQKELLEIFKDDQDIRNKYVAAQKTYGYESKAVDSLGKIMLFKDSLNLTKVERILKEKGWVGKDKIGQQANTTLFLVIQHSDLKTQQKYLPIMKDAVKKGNADASSFAYLEDRIALREGRRQIYGSQMGRKPNTNEYYILPLEDPVNVDKRRLEVGLTPLAEYVIKYDVVFDVEKYIKELPELDELNKIKN